MIFSQYRSDLHKLAVNGVSLEINKICSSIGTVIDVASKEIGNLSGDSIIVNQFNVYHPQVTEKLDALANQIFNVSLSHLGKKVKGNYQERLIERYVDYERIFPLARGQ